MILDDLAKAGKKIRPITVGVLASGRGTNFQAIVDAVERGDVPAEVVVLVSNRDGALALDRARRHGIATAVITQRSYTSRYEQEVAMVETLRQHGVELVVLAGYDRIIVGPLLVAFPDRVINVHPSLLPAFGGSLHAQAEALAYGVKVAGCTVHLVTPEVDAGPIVVQRAVEVKEDDTTETLAARILEQEHQALPQTIRLFAEGRIRREGRRIRIESQSP